MFKFIKYVCIVSLVVTPTFLKQDIAVAGGGFARSCTDVRVNDSVYGLFQGLFLFAKCGKSNEGTNNQAIISLGDNITNNDGTWVWQKNGGYQGSCKSVRIVDNHVLQATCDQADKKVAINAQIDLNEHILNESGELKYIRIMISD